VIVWVNDAWDDFCLANGGEPGRTGAGVSYLAVCDAVDDQGSRDVGAAVRIALTGDLPAPMSILIACDSPTVPRSFDVLVSSRRDDRGACIGATLTIAQTA
jgi:hypothetical protein